jgi:hypothetical protein
VREQIEPVPALHVDPQTVVSNTRRREAVGVRALHLGARRRLEHAARAELLVRKAREVAHRGREDLAARALHEARVPVRRPHSERREDALGDQAPLVAIDAPCGSRHSAREGDVRVEERAAGLRDLAQPGQTLERIPLDLLGVGEPGGVREPLPRNPIPPGGPSGSMAGRSHEEKWR